MQQSSITGWKRSTHLLAIVLWAWWRGCQRKRAWDRQCTWVCWCGTWGGRRRSITAVLRWGKPFLTTSFNPFCVAGSMSESVLHRCTRDVLFREQNFSFFLSIFVSLFCSMSDIKISYLLFDFTVTVKNRICFGFCFEHPCNTTLFV